MGLNIVVSELKQIPIEKQPLEIVERKGLGHPDYMCDAILDRVSVNLCKAYLERFGAIMHHNTDKSLLVAGEVETRFGGGSVKSPMLLIFGDRAITEVGGASVPVEDIAKKAAKDWLKENFRFIDPERHVRYQVELKPGSAALVDTFKRKGKICANDTSAAVGYAPFSKTEKIVLEVEKYLNSKDFKKAFPETGEDVKVMGVREKNELHLTVGMAFVDRFVKNEEDYFKKKAEILEQMYKFVRENTDFKKITIDFNMLDAKGRGVSGVYLTVLGTSADGADSGQVGRGNRVNGVISLNRHLCSEAAAGKNPVSHVGKIYNVLSHRIANRVYERVSGLEEVYIWLMNQIGKPIDQPVIIATQVITEPGTSLKEVEGKIAEEVDSELDNLDKLCDGLINGKIQIC